MITIGIFILLGYLLQRFINKNNNNHNYLYEIIYHNLKQNSSNSLAQTSLMFEDQIEYRKNILEHKKKYINTLKDINNNKHYLLWFRTSGINNKVIDNKPSTIIYILDINDSYNPENASRGCVGVNSSLNYLNKYCNKMKINLYIISECHPNEFIDKILINNEDISININNYLSPYNFRYTFFGYLDKLSTYSDNKLNISIEDILNYINVKTNNYLLLTNNPNIQINNIILIN
jgi:hypothetical protein